MASTESEISAAEAALTTDERRFLLDLEFVQALANPAYVRFLAEHEARYFFQPKFVEYLSYLKYFKEPQYCKFIKFPHCLFILDLLLDDKFRIAVPTSPQLTDAIYDQQRLHWEFYLANRSTSTVEQNQ